MVVPASLLFMFIFIVTLETLFNQKLGDTNVKHLCYLLTFMERVDSKTYVGLVQDLERVWVPLPQVLEQSL